MTDWRPDWRDPTAYTAAALRGPEGHKWHGSRETLSLDEWAWQFLRRNTVYQKQYEKAHAQAVEHNRQGHVDEQRTAFRKAWGISSPTDPAEDFPYLSYFIAPSGPDLTPGLVLDPERMREHLREESPYVDWLLPIPDPSEPPQDGETEAQVEWRRHLQVAVLDLRLPLTPQLRWLRRQGQSAQKLRGLPLSRQSAPTDKALLWVLYLRALDARAENVPIKEIAAELCGKDVDPGDKLKATLKQARRLTEPEGYLKFLGLPIR